MWGYPGSCGIGIGGGAFGIGLVFMILFWGVVIWAIVALVRHFSGKNSDWHVKSGSDEAMGILNERYAKGEISKEEYEERKATLIKR
ncbi:MAG: hypothetical protein ACD_5C00254G0001 [uncultured bacterium]|nr:MAG: hypothetical protein ACD_5C00254G0001 [uncultured bacterium]